MALTKVELTGAFAREDGTLATGYLIAQLTGPMRHEGLVVAPVPIRAVISSVENEQLLGEDEKEFELYATDDTGTTGATSYCFTLQLDGLPPRQFYSAVPHLPGVMAITELPGWIE